MGASVLSEPMPPTSAGASPPSPIAPWHLAPRRSKSSLPSATVPLPGGKPAPSGAMSMSQPAISSSVAGCPKPNAPLGVDIAHLSTGRDGPGLDGVVVKEGVDPAGFDQLSDRGLDVAGLVDGPAQQLGRLA